MLEIYLLSILMILGAMLAISLPNLMAAVISMGIVGYSLALSFMFLGAPDLAIVQIIVETMSLIILIAAIIKTTEEDTPEEKKLARIPVYIGGAGFFAIFLLMFVRISGFLPGFGHPALRMASDYIASGFEQTGAPNLVAAVILNLRGYDTLGEATVLFAAVVGLVVVLRKTGRKK
ncbi:hypothetical protein CH333_00620 [candidate division WOR-3 bacterium JGI_Cruoil_03_44_89]|uniref:Uncharacterized protein n=1 Tax=candidate division WOR-3 bacterium JGI_Cruoil_03_44_89 TaxID=1973748 RepID=A0A235C147_UNCW3|nr:MAG: hypothetical protein CH333_00620 [candidate division WOR-3 bacterium JGI_Cruoil_03_44_89]